MDNYTDDQVFDKADFTIKPLPKGAYDNCDFTGCNFSGTDLSGIHFSECRFTGCNISTARIAKTAFKDCTFKECKMVGLAFDTCDDFLFEVRFDHCTLNLSSFAKRKMKKTVFNHSILHEVDFSDADLSSVVFDHADLSKAIFDNTILEKADFRTAHYFSVDPERNKIKKAKFSADGLAGLLYKYDIEIA